MCIVRHGTVNACSHERTAFSHPLPPAPFPEAGGRWRTLADAQIRQGASAIKPLIMFYVSRVHPTGGRCGRSFTSPVLRMKRGGGEQNKKRERKERPQRPPIANAILLNRLGTSPQASASVRHRAGSVRPPGPVPAEGSSGRRPRPPIDIAHRPAVGRPAGLHGSFPTF